MLCLAQSSCHSAHKYGYGRNFEYLDTFALNSCNKIQKRIIFLMCYILRVNRHISYSHTFLHMALAFLTNIILTFPSCKIKYKLYWIKFFTTTPKLYSEINIVYCIVTISRNNLTANHTKFPRLMPYSLINVIKTAVAKMSKKNGFIS